MHMADLTPNGGYRPSSGDSITTKRHFGDGVFPGCARNGIASGGWLTASATEHDDLRLSRPPGDQRASSMPNLMRRACVIGFGQALTKGREPMRCGMAVFRRALWLAAVVLAVAFVSAGCGSGAASPVARRTAVPAGYRLPAVGAPGYPEDVYPPAVRPRHAGIVTACPAPAGLVTPPGSVRAAAIAAVRAWETSGWAAALHDADRVLWPQVAGDYRHHWVPRLRYRGPVLYAGALLPARRNFGVPNPAGWIIGSCGRRVAGASYLIVTGSRNEPALQGALVFIDRHGHLLLYFSY
jgi:hypothetical protein